MLPYGGGLLPGYDSDHMKPSRRSLKRLQGIFIFDVGKHQFDIAEFYLLQGNGFF
jgi:hypothetical protein